MLVDTLMLETGKQPVIIDVQFVEGKHIYSKIKLSYRRAVMLGFSNQVYSMAENTPFSRSLHHYITTKIQKSVRNLYLYAAEFPAIVRLRSKCI